MKISVVVPVYGCPAAVRPLCSRVSDTLRQITDDFEIIMVNDACPRNSWAEIEKVCEENPHVVGIELSKNFGQIRAITAGLDYCSGDWVVVMDCDLQDRPEGILDLYNKAQEGYDVVFARRFERKDNAVVKFFNKAYYKVYDFFTDETSDNTICNFSISRREVIDNFNRIQEKNRDFTLMIKWLGYRQTSIDIEADHRLEGKSSYNFRRKLALATQLITAQSNKPLQISMFSGFVIATCAFLYMIYAVVNYVVSGGASPLGWTSLIVSIYFLSGTILVAIGVLGIYIGYIFNEVKQRPIYIVRSIKVGDQTKLI